MGDPAWQPLINNPNYPDYTSGANSVTGAMTRTLELFFGTDKVAFEVETAAPQAVQKVRRYYRFSDAARDVVDARILLGIHFRFADTAARTQGRSVADWTFNHFLLPLGRRDHQRTRSMVRRWTRRSGFRARNRARRCWLRWPPRRAADVIMDWNARADAVAAEKRLPPPVQGRALALMHVSMFEAINAIERRYKPYRLELVADRNTSREAAAASAAHAVLTALYADQRAALDAQLAADLAAVAEGPAKERGIILGRKAAADLLELHAEDGAGADDYRPFTQAGVYVPTQPVAGYLVRTFKPWVMTSAAQFRAAPPPALTSETWTRDVNEIREVRCAQ